MTPNKYTESNGINPDYVQNLENRILKIKGVFATIKNWQEDPNLNFKMHRIHAAALKDIRRFVFTK